MVKKVIFNILVIFLAIPTLGMDITLSHKDTTKTSTIKMGLGLTMHRAVVDRFLKESLDYKNTENNTLPKPEFKGIISYGGGREYYSNMGKLIKAAREGTIGKITLGVNTRLLNNQKTQKPINKLIEVAGDKADIKVSSRYHDKSLWTQYVSAIISQNWSNASLGQPEGGLISEFSPIKDGTNKSIQRAINLIGKKYKGDGIVPVTPEKDKEKQETYFLSGNIPKESEFTVISSSEYDIAAFRFAKLKELENSDTKNGSVCCSTMTMSPKTIKAYTDVAKKGGEVNLTIAHQGVTDSNLEDLQNLTDAGGKVSVHNNPGKIHHFKANLFKIDSKYSIEIATQNHVSTISGKDSNTSFYGWLNGEQHDEIKKNMVENPKKDSHYTDFNDYKEQHIEKKKKQKEKKEQKKKDKSTKNTVSDSTKRKRDDIDELNKEMKSFKKQKLSDTLTTKSSVQKRLCFK